MVLVAADLVGQEPVPELGIVAVCVMDRVGEVGLVELGVDDRREEPAVVGLASETEYPTRHHDGDAVDGKLAHQRIHQPFGRFACPRYAAARRSTSFSCSSSRIRFFASRNSASSLLASGS